jgi:hypothetical protein
VYLCRDRQTLSLVAVKVLRTELAESVGAERFLREIRLTAGLDHPNVVPVIDSGADGSTLYCVLPYMEGGTLRDALLERKQLPIDRAVEIGSTIANALAYAHAKGLIHRDIKPENILFSGGQAYLGDFGIARLLYATASDLTTTTGVVRGTPAYMSPEQASGERMYDGRSDIYSLAAVVYEMVSGMPPFVGPTAQSVLAQRFSSTPRPMRTYRTTVPAELDQVIAKAMCTSPADRYATADGFADALRAANARPVAKPGPRPARMIVGVAVVLVAAAIIAFSVSGKQSWWQPDPGVSPDTSQLAVLPFQRDSNTESLGSVDAFIYDAFSAWRGITVLDPFQVRDAVARHQAVSGVERDRVVAASLGAGRFVRGEVNALPAGQGWRVHASLHQLKARGDTLLYDHTITIGPDQLRSINERYAALASAVLLRGADSSAGTTVATTTSLPARQAFTRGLTAVGDWDLATADSQFQRAVEQDAGYARAYLWQAQIRSWQGLGPDAWLPLIAKAVADSTRLSDRDREVGVALFALGRRDFAQACALYRELRDRNQTDFAAWFGLGLCIDSDYRVEPDPTSPTGWRYLASYQAAVDAYTRAFETLSLSHLGMERGSFEPLRDLLFMRASQIRKATLLSGEEAPFWGRLDLAGDTLVMRPVPRSALAAGSPTAVPANMRAAIASQRDLFRSIAASWSASLPLSAGAREAVAIALEMRGDPSALDTLRSARRIAMDEQMKLRLAVSDALMQLKFLDPSRPEGVSAIVVLADSLLSSHPNPGRFEAAHLAPLAMLRGQCDRAGDLAAIARTSTQPGVSGDIIGDADALATRIAGDCAINPREELERLRRRIETTAGASRGAVNSLLARPVQLMDGGDLPLLDEFIRRTGGYLLRAQLAARQHQSDSVLAILARVDSSRQRSGYADVTPDAVFLEARAYLMVGDTTRAIGELDRLFQRMASITPGLLHRPVAMGGLIRTMRLRAQLQQQSRAGQPDWGAVAQALFVAH